VVRYKWHAEDSDRRDEEEVGNVGNAKAGACSTTRIYSGRKSKLIR
jgi:hypothetical protein